MSKKITKTTKTPDNAALLATLKFTKIERRTTTEGAWATGTIGCHDFQALVFLEHAENEAYELGDSRISKLWLRDQTTKAEVASFDRGWDRQPTTDTAKAIVDLLAAGLAETVWGK